MYQYLLNGIILTCRGFIPTAIEDVYDEFFSLSTCIYCKIKIFLMDICIVIDVNACVTSLY